MKKTIITTLAVLTLATTQLAWGGGGCDDSSCREAGQQEQSVTGPETEAQPQSKGRARNASVDDFVTPDQSSYVTCPSCEPGGAGGVRGKSEGKPQPEPRVPEKKCSQEPC